MYHPKTTLWPDCVSYGNPWPSKWPIVSQVYFLLLLLPFQSSKINSAVSWQFVFRCACIIPSTIKVYTKLNLNGFDIKAFYCAYNYFWDMWQSIYIYVYFFYKYNFFSGEWYCVSFDARSAKLYWGWFVLAKAG